LSSHRFKAAVAAAVAVLAVPASATAATKVVSIGPSKADEETFNKAFADVNDFFPHGTTIHAGDSIAFKPGQFHTVDLPPKGGKPLGLLGATGTVSGALDAAGAPFWFNGQPSVAFHPGLAKVLYGKKVTYTGAKRVESGLPLAPRLKAFTVKFPKAGSYTFYCNVHIGMKGTVRVVSKRHKIPSAKADAKALKAQIARDLKTAKGLAATTVPAGNVSVGASGKGGVELYVMVPATQTVPVGTTVKFSMSALSFEDHTASFGPGDPENQPTSYLGTLAASFNSPAFAPEAVYPSEPPGTIGSLSPTLHGNGFWNAGVLDNSSATPLPNSSSVMFSAAGTYQFYCLIHPFMHGTVVVQ
jgi:plastocyanin